MNTNTYTFTISGIHCASCALLIEHTLIDIPNISTVQVNTKTNTLTITTEKSIDEIFILISTALAPHGYNVGEKNDTKRPFSTKSLLYAAIIFGSFIFLQRLNIIQINTANTLSLPTIFLIGIAASISSCMAVVGSLVLGLSSPNNTLTEKLHAHSTFHIARLISFFIFGAAIGAIGKTLTFSENTTTLLHIGTALLLIALGANMIGILPKSIRLPTLPTATGRHILRAHAIPTLLGVLTFVLPCGFTQSMQLYTLGTQSAVHGGLTMGIFALGTLPMLTLLSIGAIQGTKIQTAWKNASTTIGYVIMFFGTYTLYTTFVVTGLLPPISFF